MPRKSGKPKKGEVTVLRFIGTGPSAQVEFYLAGQFKSDEFILVFARLFRQATSNPRDRIAYQFFREVYGPSDGINAEEVYKKRRILIEKKYKHIIWPKQGDKTSENNGV